MRTVLESEALTGIWKSELAAMCRRINAVREALAIADPRLVFLSRQRGVFSVLPIATSCIAVLRRDHGIYMAESGRVNLAGLQIGDVETFVSALGAVGALA